MININPIKIIAVKNDVAIVVKNGSSQKYSDITKLSPPESLKVCGFINESGKTCSKKVAKGNYCKAHKTS